MHHHKYRRVVAHYDEDDDTPIRESAICCCCEDDAGKRMASYRRALSMSKGGARAEALDRLFPDKPKHARPLLRPREPYFNRCAFCGRDPGKRQLNEKTANALAQ